jgi:hypothetical protein
MKREFKMDLLNAEEIKGINGGVAVVMAGVQSFETVQSVDAAAGCSKTGDTIFEKCVKLVGDVKIVLCATYEATCPATFTSSCGLGDVNCSANFKLKCISKD